MAGKRWKGCDRQYEYADVIKAAYGIFFFKHPSMLRYQERLKKKKERSSVKTILNVKSMPGNNKLRGFLDVAPLAFLFAPEDARWGYVVLS
jgi:hypothetical protein